MNTAITVLDWFLAHALQILGALTLLATVLAGAGHAFKMPRLVKAAEFAGWTLSALMAARAGAALPEAPKPDAGSGGGGDK